MSRTVSVVLRWSSSAPPALAHAVGVPLGPRQPGLLERRGGRHVRRPVVSGVAWRRRSAPACWRRRRAGRSRSSRTPAPALFGHVVDRAPTGPRPEPPGPPGLTSMTPWYARSGTVCLTRETASLIVAPAGLRVVQRHGRGSRTRPCGPSRSAFVHAPQVIAGCRRDARRLRLRVRTRTWRAPTASAIVVAPPEVFSCPASRVDSPHMRPARAAGSHAVHAGMYHERDR